MSAIGAAIILGILVVILLRMKVARVPVVVVCVLFGLVLGATPIGDGVYAAVASVGRWASQLVQGL
jgi:Kef-type K+ transport system membrane component KefB